MKISEMVREDEDFPTRLMRVKPQIKQLWHRGELKAECLKKTVAIVGSRRMSRYGRAIVEEVVPRLCSSGYTIVSGLMYGVDQLAHKTTLECGGVAVAVLGWGIERANDPESDRLADEIVANGGVVISEYPEDLRGQLWTFPQRNRIVVGLSDIVIVVEAGIKSGTMSTAKWAQKMKVPVYAVPGSVFSKTSEGANYMVESGLAKPLTPKVIEGLCSVKNSVRVTKYQHNLSDEEIVLINYLTVIGPSSVNEIARGMGITVGEVLTKLSTLEIKGVLKEDRGLFAIV